MTATTETTKSKEHLLDWLRDAYAMEIQAQELLEKQLNRLENYPTLAMRLREHLEETKDQAQQIEGCIKMLDADTSMVKNALGKISANLTGMAAIFSSDEILKSSIASAAFEEYEVASYKILIAAAEHAGEVKIANICRAILLQEEAMAAWLKTHIPQLTTDFLVRDELDVKAKV